MRKRTLNNGFTVHTDIDYLYNHLGERVRCTYWTGVFDRARNRYATKPTHFFTQCEADSYFKKMTYKYMNK